MWDWQYAGFILPKLGWAAIITFQVTIGAFVVAAVFGMVLALARRSSKPLLRVPAAAFVEFIRSTPPLVQLYFVFYVFPFFGVVLTPLVAGVLSLGVHYSTYISEVYRAGIDAVDQEQWAAAKALNFTRGKTWTRIILPQAIPPIVPMLGNYLNVMFKESVLVSTIGLVELLQTALILGTDFFRYLEPITLVGVIFLIMSYPFSLFVGWLERTLVSEKNYRTPGRLEGGIEA